MKFCETKSGVSKDIEIVQERIKNDVVNVKQFKKEVEFAEEIVISKEEHIRRLYLFIEHVAINFREENYNEVDIALRKINL